jgi:uncharacterized membrane protein YfcA
MPSAVPIELLVFILASFIGALVAGVAGFAFGLIASAIWLHAIAPTQSAALIAAFAIVIQGSTLWKLRHAIDVPRLLPFLIGGALGIPVGAEVLRWAAPAHMRAFVGLALVLFSVYSLARPKLPTVKGGSVADGAVGVMSGLLGGSTGLAGIPVIVWATVRGWSKDEQRAVFQPVAVAVFFTMLGWFGATGMITADTVRLFLIGLPAVLLGTWLGFKLYGKLDDAAFRIIVLILLLVSGLTLLPSVFLSGN